MQPLLNMHSSFYLSKKDKRRGVQEQGRGAAACSCWGPPPFFRPPPSPPVRFLSDGGEGGSLIARRAINGRKVIEGGGVLRPCSCPPPRPSFTFFERKRRTGGK
nr:hypothetical protein [Morchella crassipes]